MIYDATIPSSVTVYFDAIRTNKKEPYYLSGHKTSFRDLSHTLDTTSYNQLKTTTKEGRDATCPITAEAPTGGDYRRLVVRRKPLSHFPKVPVPLRLIHERSNDYLHPELRPIRPSQSNGDPPY